MNIKYRCYYYKRGESNLERDWRWKDLMAGSSILAKSMLLGQLKGDYIVAKMVKWAN